MTSTHKSDRLVILQDASNQVDRNKTSPALRHPQLWGSMSSLATALALSESLVCRSCSCTGSGSPTELCSPTHTYPHDDNPKLLLRRKTRTMPWDGTERATCTRKHQCTRMYPERHNEATWRSVNTNRHG
jgi:hypothetical protein